MIEIQDHGKVREIRLARPPVNALGPELVGALRAALADARRDQCEGVVLSGRPGMFSAGLDLKALLVLQRDSMGRFWREFFSLLRDTASHPVPVVAAITGHSPAGGAVLSLFCDRRVAAAGDFKFGLNEVQVGLVVPKPIQNAVVRLIGAHRAEQLLVRGALLNPDDALAVGLVDEVTAPDKVVESSVAWLAQMAALPRTAMLETRKLLRAPLVDLFEQFTQSDFEEMLEHWFLQETQQSLHGVLARLAGRSAD